MKRFFNKTVLFVAFVAVFVSCSKDENKKTIASLKDAIIEEANAKAKYAAFAEKATEEGYLDIANMFRAASAAENLHFTSHNKALVKLGEPEFKPTAAAPTVNSTKENIQASIANETEEFTTMYPNFISIAKKEKCEGAEETFNLAKIAEENHARRFSAALEAIEGGDTPVSSVFYVCRRCGGMFIAHFAKCGLCQADTQLQYYEPLVFSH